MKVLVTGKAGQLALALAQAAKRAGLDLTALGRPELDLADPTSIARAFDRLAPDLAVNTAAYTGVDKAESEPEAAHAINADGAAHVARACERKGIPLIHISTDYVFDGTKAGPYREDDPVAPLGVYGRSKLEGERRVAEACSRHIILRTAWVVSPFGHNFVKTMLRLAPDRPEIGVVDDQCGNPTYAPHLAAAILAMSQICRRERGGTPWGLYHAAGGGEATWCDLAREVFRLSASHGGPAASVRPITTAEYPTAARRPANSRLDCAKLAATFGFRLPEWHIGVAECVELLSRDTGTTDSVEKHKASP